jgi:hypothetical protein
MYVKKNLLGVSGYIPILGYDADAQWWAKTDTGTAYVRIIEFYREAPTLEGALSNIFSC